MATTPPPVNPSAADAEWYRWVESNLESNRVNVRNANVRANAAVRQATIVGDQTAAQEQVITPKTLTSERPFGVLITQNQGVWLPDGTTVAGISLQWEQVTTTTEGTVAMAAEYEVWHSLAGAPYTRVTATAVPTASFVLPANVEVTFIVRARTNEGLWSEYSDPVATLTAQPPAITAAPTTPVLDSALGTVAVTWNGQLTSGTPGTELWHVYAEEATASSGPWTRVGQPLNGAGSINVTPPVGATRWYRLIAVDKLARTSPASTSASIVVAGVETADLDSAITAAITEAQNDADAALTAANGKNKVYYQATAPTGGTYQTGDTWFDTDDNYKMYVRTPSNTWQLAQDSATAISTANTANSTANAANTTAGNALTAANGKNKVWHQAAQPGTTGNTVGDTWFDSDDGNKIYEWSGSAWVANELGTNALADLAITNAKIADGTIQNAKILDGTILNAKIADGTIQTAKIGDSQITNAKIADATIQSAKIAAMDAGKITTGTLDANRIGANTITTSKLLITNMNNLLMDPGFEYNSAAAWTLSDGAVNATAAPRSGARHLSVATTGSQAVFAFHPVRIAVQPGETYRVGYWVRLAAAGTPGDNGVTFRFRTSPTETGALSNGTDFVTTPNTVGTTYTYVTGTYTIPAGVYWVQPDIIVRDTVTGKTYYVDDIEMFKMSDGSLIVDGAITADKIGAGEVTTPKLSAGAVTAEKIAVGTIEANNLAPSVGSSLDISANGSINILVGQTSANAEILTAHQDLIDGLESDVNGVGGVADLAADAIANAETAQTTANAAASTAADAASTVQALGQTYRFTVNGAFIGAPNSPYEFVIQNTGAEIRYNGVVVTKWDSGQMQVGNFLGESITIGQHKLERYGTSGGTVLRYVG